MQKIAQIRHSILDGAPLQVLRFDPQEDNDLHYHDFHELVIIEGGEALHLTATETYRIGAGDVFLIRPGDAHGYSRTNGLELINILYFRDRLNLPLFDLGDLPGYHAFFELEPEMRRRYGFHKHLQVGKKNLDFLSGASRELKKHLDSGEPGRLFSAVSIFMQIIACIAGSCAPHGVPAHGEHRLLWEQSRLASDLERHWQEPFDLEALARRHGMSSSTLYRRFMRTFGKSPLEFLLDLRIDRAREALRNTSLSIGRIAEASGFSDSNYFSRCFRQHTGMSPSDYRRRMQN